uniref:Translation initiation factor IF-3, N-terminal domain n=1 Tax=Myoviridae sp. ctoIO8 TaxID=2825173 RepID=A0A8S5P1D1_9CAUD|nr:MAG TPA: Translation initiation factor IF-3, N-terminal domain [Myoviridae sp. ctoIO8]
MTIPPICGIIDIEQYRHEYRTLFVLGVSLEIKAWE